MRFVRRILGTQEDAEDVLQEATRRVLAHGRCFISEEELKMYLGRAIFNCAIEFYHARRRARRREAMLRHYCRLPTVERADPHLLLEEVEAYNLRLRRLEVLEKALRRLSNKQYQAVRMTVMENAANSLRKACTLNGIPYSTLRHRSRQGLANLRRLVQRALRVYSPRVTLI